MRISIIVEADYNSLDDQSALKKENMQQNFNLIAKLVEDDFRNRRGEQNKYGIFYQIYKLDAGARIRNNRKDGLSDAIVQMSLDTKDPKVPPTKTEKEN